MTFEVEVNGRVRVVSIEATGPVEASGGRFRVVLDDPIDGTERRESSHHSFAIDARRTNLGVSILHVADHRSIDTAIVERAGGEYLVQLRHVSLLATVDGRRSRREAASGAKGKGEQRITAPMPGRVVRVLVKEGDQVEAQQGLVVIEAMKMENELAAVRPGRVIEVAVSDGMSVEAGRLLVRVE